ncbi:hypothetical protein, partial [Okeania sp. SIO2G5]|uniref:hypothetical protein n=1 Tax=Okeania sp. SIO2G5 TaxID=2607796 RepID=UPI0013C06A0A|nr:hypothetical protein [Okeania sp. SIO2G5]
MRYLSKHFTGAITIQQQFEILTLLVRRFCMGMPAARVGDLVSHVVPPVLGPGPGSTNVLIGGMPAWRAMPMG